MNPPNDYPSFIRPPHINTTHHTITRFEITANLQFSYVYLNNPLRKQINRYPLKCVPPTVIIIYSCQALVLTLRWGWAEIITSYRLPFLSHLIEISLVSQQEQSILSLVRSLSLLQWLRQHLRRRLEQSKAANLNDNSYIYEMTCHIPVARCPYLGSKYDGSLTLRSCCNWKKTWFRVSLCAQHGNMDVPVSSLADSVVKKHNFCLLQYTTGKSLFFKS